MNVILILTTLLLSFAFGMLMFPKVIKFCLEHNLFDAPNSRKTHKNPTPRLGGICFLPAAFASLILIVVGTSHLRQGGIEESYISTWTVSLFLCLAIIYILGLIDDIIGLSAKTKFIVQAAAACILASSGLLIDNLYGLFGIEEISPYIGFPFTVFVIIYICNAINLIDGIDGLSSSLAVIAFSGFAYMFLTNGMLTYCIFIVAMIGVLFAFARYNLFGQAERHTKIFMGDAGSLSIGFIISFLFVKTIVTSEVGLPTTPFRLTEATSLILIPVFDVVRVSIERILHHRSIFAADKNHIHHKLMRAGLSQHSALIVIICFALLFIAMNHVLKSLVNINIILVADVVVWSAFFLIVNLCIHKRGEQSFLIPE